MRFLLVVYASICQALDSKGASSSQDTEANLDQSTLSVDSGDNSMIIDFDGKELFIIRTFKIPCKILKF